jgi:hypothetical protein
MTVQRILLGLALAGGSVGAASAQTVPDYPMRPAAAFPSGPTTAGVGYDPATVNATPLSAGTGVPTESVPLLGGSHYGGTPANSMGTLTSQGMLPPGSVPGPWVGGNRAGACCGPVGANGPVTYELFTRTGPSLIVGGGSDLSGATHFGWMVEGGGRSLLFNTANDAAWTLSLSLMYAYNDGGDRIFDVFARQPRNATTGLLNGPDQIQPFRLRGLTRTGLNYAVGRDWWLNGPGPAGLEQGWNSRVGVDVGGNYGTIRADLLPIGNLNSYFRRYSVTNGVQFGAHWDTDIPLGGWVFFTGARIQYGFHWSNVIPPLDGNFQDLNLLLTAGVRF